MAPCVDEGVGKQARGWQECKGEQIPQKEIQLYLGKFPKAYTLQPSKSVSEQKSYRYTHLYANKKYAMTLLIEV